MFWILDEERIKRKERSKDRKRWREQSIRWPALHLSYLNPEPTALRVLFCSHLHQFLAYHSFYPSALKFLNCTSVSNTYVVNSWYFLYSDKPADVVLPNIETLNMSIYSWDVIKSGMQSKIFQVTQLVCKENLLNMDMCVSKTLHPTNDLFF